MKSKSLIVALTLTFSTIAQAGTTWLQADQAVFTSKHGSELESRVMSRQTIREQFPESINLDGLHYYDSFSSAGADVVEACSKQAPVGTVRSQSFHVIELCKKTPWPLPDTNHEWDASYRVSRDWDGTHLAMKVRYQIDLSNSPAWQERLNQDAVACGSWVREFWSRYGIHFDLEIDSNIHPTPGEPDTISALLNQRCRSNSSKICYQAQAEVGESMDYLYASMKRQGVSGLQPTFAQYYEPIRQELMCRAMTHEIGHHLGMGDHYVEADCPDRIYTIKHTLNQTDKYYDLMDDPTSENWNSTHVMPADLRRIVAPLCSQ